MIHCRPATSAWRSLPIAGRATLTTVPSRKAIPEPSAVAASTHLALAVPNAIRSAPSGCASTMSTGYALGLPGKIQLKYYGRLGGRDALPDRERGCFPDRAAGFGEHRTDRVEQSARHDEIGRQA